MYFSCLSPKISYLSKALVSFIREGCLETSTYLSAGMLTTTEVMLCIYNTAGSLLSQSAFYPEIYGSPGQFMFNLHTSKFALCELPILWDLTSV